LHCFQLGCNISYCFEIASGPGRIYFGFNVERPSASNFSSRKTGVPMIGASILFVAVSIMIFVLGWKFSVNRDGLQINHCTLVGWGFLFYWLLPIGYGLFGIAHDDFIVTLWSKYFNQLSETCIVEYLLLTAATAAAFFYGSYLGFRKGGRFQKAYKLDTFNIKILTLPFVISTIFAGIYAYQARNDLFKLYNEFTLKDDNGLLLTGSVFLLIVCLIYGLRLMELKPNVKFRELILNPYFLTYLVILFLVLSIGRRFYVMSAMVSLIVLYTNYFRRLNLMKFLLSAMVGAILVGSFGQLRLGAGLKAVSPFVLVSYESLLDSMSLVASLKQDIHQFIRFPVYLLSDFTAIVPPAISGRTKGWQIDPQDDGFRIFSPQGGVNSYVEFMINFGDFGTILCFFALGYGLSRLRAVDGSLMDRYVYVILSGWIAFTFFRDSFELSIVKQMVEISVIIPFAMMYALRWLSSHVFTAKQIGMPLVRHRPALPRPDIPTS
jgi:hypothetical protein